MSTKNLSDWLNWIQSVHPSGMELGLDRVSTVANHLNLLKQPGCFITVGGTNGKGTCVAGLEAIYLSSGYRVGAFTSPVLFRHNEYVRIQGKPVEDADFCLAYEAIEACRQEIVLTPFEYHTLAALFIFKKANLEVCLLEVGLGGRLDAVNIIDADLSVIASIGMDHMDWLGHTREAIAREKAGIFRKNQPVVCGDFDPPETLISQARILQCPFYYQGKDFSFEKRKEDWDFCSEENRLTHLPLPNLALQNLATVLMAVHLLQKKLPVSRQHIDKGIKNVTLPGRIQVMKGSVEKIFDVSHNPDAVSFLVEYLKDNPAAKKTRAVFSMLADKDISGTLAVIKEYITEWFVAPLPVPRGASETMLREAFQQSGISDVCFFSSIEAAYQKAVSLSEEKDRLIIFGSFHTVSAIQSLLSL